jgi:hypothetical protein
LGQRLARVCDNLFEATLSRECVMTKHQAEPVRPTPATTIEKLGFTIPEAAESSSLGQTSIYKAIRDRKLKARKYGTAAVYRILASEN